MGFSRNLNSDSYAVLEDLDNALRLDDALREWKTNDRLTFQQRVRLCYEMAVTVRYLHELNVVIKFLSDRSIFIRNVGDEFMPVLTNLEYSRSVLFQSLPFSI